MYVVILLGVATGCRSMTPIAVLCWYMWLAKLPISGWNFWEANIFAVVVFSIFAVGEYFGDVSPKAPSRKAWGPLLARVVLGMLVGASVFSSFMEPLAGGLVFGGVGALIGTYGGYALRMRFAKRLGRDFPAAVIESVLTLLLSVAVMHNLATQWVTQAALPH